MNETRNEVTQINLTSTVIASLKGEATFISHQDKIDCDFEKSVKVKSAGYVNK